MEAQLPIWMVSDGQIPEMAVGDQVRLSLQIWAWQRLQPDQSLQREGLRPIAAPDPQKHSGAFYDLASTVVWSGEQLDAWWVIDVAGVPFVVRPGPVAAAQVAPRASRLRAPWRWPIRARRDVEGPPPPSVGELTELRGTVEVAFGYECEDVPVDGERDWIVEAITVHQQPVRRSGTSRREPGTPTTVIERPLSRMNAWADESEGMTATYVIEAAPVLR